MQGSEAKVVIIPFHSSFAYFLNRQWVYTAISRASEICITIGDVITFKKACQRPGTSQFRETRLKEKLIRMVQDERDKSKSIGGEIESGPATAATEEKERQIDSQ
jgi:ATP-dependent exoDNAse (exonuclease V) alpha subunit